MGQEWPCLSAAEPHSNSTFKVRTKGNDCPVTAVATRWQVQKSDWSLTGRQIFRRKWKVSGRQSSQHWFITNLCSLSKPQMHKTLSPLFLSMVVMGPLWYLGLDKLSCHNLRGKM